MSLQTDPIDHVDSSGDTQVQANDMQINDKEYKGFVDIVELHTFGRSSHTIELMPTSDFCPDDSSSSSSTTSSSPSNEYTDYTDHAVVLRRVWEQRKRSLSLVRIELEMHSERLCRAFRDLAGPDVYAATDLKTVPVKFKTPFMPLFFHRQGIAALAADETLDEELRRDVQTLDAFVKTNGLLTSLAHDHDRFLPEGKVPAEMLWTAFRPNSLVVVEAMGVREAWICRSVFTHRAGLDAYNWVVTGLRIGHDGHMANLSRRYFHLPVLGQALVDVADLPVVPAEHCRDWPAVEAQLRQRASRLRGMLGDKLDGFSSQTYAGAAWMSDSPHHDRLEERAGAVEDLEERVMADFHGLPRTGRRPRTTDVNDMGRVWGRNAAPKDPEPPRGMFWVDAVGPPVVVVGPPGRGPPPPGRPPGRGPPPPGRPPQPVYPPHGVVYHGAPPPGVPPMGRRPRRDHHGGGYASDDTGSDSDWDFAGYDDPAPPRRPAENNRADPMEYKAFGGSGASESKTTSQRSDDLAGLCELATECYGVSAESFELLFPALVPAFGLKSKAWRWVLTDKLCPVEWNTAAFEALQLEGGTKDLIQALVRGHKSKASFDDVVPGKGQGLVFLLHGKPGLGKTLTAESVADYLQRPLYVIDGGELSTHAGPLELDLHNMFKLTRRWDAVMLLDEADVLLCRRKSSEMDRNAVVAVFLRKIEYLQGVLFLTTNRRADFDDAFRSRIHLTVSYPDLSEEAQAVIWKGLIANNKAVEVDDMWDDHVFAVLGKLGLNGRTIRNFLRTAVSFAHSRNESLGVRHVLEIIETELKGEGFNVFSLTDEEHTSLARTHEALGMLNGLVKKSQSLDDTYGSRMLELFDMQRLAR